MQFCQCVADVREAVYLPPERKFQILVGELMELLEHATHPRIIDGVKAIWRCGHGCETHFLKTEFVSQMTKDSDNIRKARCQRDARCDRPRAMFLDKLAYFRGNNVVTPTAVSEHPQLVMHLL